MAVLGLCWGCARKGGGPVTTIVFERTTEPTLEEMRADMRGIVRSVERIARIESVRTAVAIAQRTGSINVIAPLDGLLELFEAANQ